MARIRSTHPGQWRDQDFVECSFAARLLALALRNEADDQGVFEWKPKQIKMACFPADSVDIDALLSEIVSANMVRQYEMDGRKYGAIRNFRLYQRPKTPNSVYPLTDEVREYVCLTKVKVGNAPPSTPPISEIDDDEAPTLPQKEETLRKSAEQVEDVGGRVEEEKESISLAPLADTSTFATDVALNGSELPDPPAFLLRKPKAPDRFPEFYAAYPLHKAPGDAEKAWKSALKDATPDEIIAGAKRYAIERAGQDKKFTKHPGPWLREKRWLDEVVTTVNGSHEPTLDELLASKQKAESLGLNTHKLDRAIEEKRTHTTG